MRRSILPLVPSLLGHDAILTAGHRQIIMRMIDDAGLFAVAGVKVLKPLKSDANILLALIKTISEPPYAPMSTNSAGAEVAAATEPKAPNLHIKALDAD